MRRILTREEMREAEQCTIQEHFVSSLILMERAALSVCDVLYSEKILLDRPLIVCGTGNNGGDGLAIARILYERGSRPIVVMTGNCEHSGTEVQCQKKSLESYGIEIHDKIPKLTYTVVIDALLGIGLSRELTGVYYDTVSQMNAISAVKVAVDIPSGIDANTGAIMGISFHADMTVTFAYAKPGLYLYPGTNRCGRIIVKDIGIMDEIARQPFIRMYTKEDRILPKRQQPSHKGTYGKVLLFAGSSDMCGAVLLSAEAVMRTGAGMVKIVTAECNRDLILKRIPEAMLLLYRDDFLETEEDQGQLDEALRWADVIGAGPGISQRPVAERILEYLIRHSEKPLILDADALNLISNNVPDIRWDRDVVVTPHIKEMERLSGIPSKQLQSDPIRYAREYAKKHSVICVLKDARTVIAAPDGDVFLNVNGNPGMATAGAGDVLTGMICALTAQGMPAFRAAASGVYLHAASGDDIAVRTGEYSMIASDLIKGFMNIEPEMTEQ